MSCGVSVGSLQLIKYFFDDLDDVNNYTEYCFMQEMLRVNNLQLRNI